MAASRYLLVLPLVGLVGCALAIKPQGQGPQWIDRGVSDLTDALGKPNYTVRLPPPSLSSVLLYTGGAQPGYAVCQYDYFVRGATVVGFTAHGTDPKCTGRAGNTQ